MLKVYNTLSRKKEVFKPRKDKIVHMFVCGPTVYDYSHLGHARSYVAFDVIAKYLRFKGYKLTYIQNITDVDDKIIAKAKALGTDPLQLAKKFENAYYKDMKALGVDSVDRYLPASKHMPQIIDQIKRLIKKGFAYVAKDGVWFEVAKFKDYGKLSGQKPEDLRKHRIEPSPYKKSYADFSLWKKQKPGEPAWDSPWGKGRPGWHIEDTAITETYFGPQYDIHGGGQDLIFPHHECEIAQIEAVSGKKPLVKYWLHNGFLLVNGEKMSKSRGNFLTIRDALKKYSSEVLRLFFATTHYRAPLDFSEQALTNAKAVYSKIEDFVLRLKGYSSGVANPEIKKSITLLKKNFEKEMDNDFNIAGAMTHLFLFMSKINRWADNQKASKEDTKAVLRALYDLDKVLCIGLKKIKLHKLPSQIMRLIKERELARKNKDFKKADKIRTELRKKGILLEDLPDGRTRWKLLNRQ